MAFNKKRIVYKSGKHYYSKTYHPKRKQESNHALGAAAAAVGAYLFNGIGERSLASSRQPPAAQLPPARIETSQRTFHYTGGNNHMDALDHKIVESFPGKIVRKDLTAMLKRGANVPTFVLEYLLGM